MSGDGNILGSNASIQRGGLGASSGNMTGDALGSVISV
jgi:hypothetical protein